MTPYARQFALVFGGILLAGVLGYCGGRREVARVRAQLEYRTRTETLRVNLVRLDTVYQRDTVRLWRLVREVDTLVVPESIPVIAADSARAESVIVKQAEALDACVATVRTCEDRARMERLLRLAAESTVVAWGAPRRTIGDNTKPFVVGGLLGILFGAFVVK